MSQELFLKTHIYEVIISVVLDVNVMDLNIVGRSKLPISRTDLDFFTNVVVSWRKCQIISSTGRIAEVRPFALSYESTNYVDIVDAFDRFYDKNARESRMIKVRDALSALSMDCNCVPPYMTREAWINIRNKLKLK